MRGAGDVGGLARVMGGWGEDGRDGAEGGEGEDAPAEDGGFSRGGDSVGRRRGEGGGEGEEGEEREKEGGEGVHGCCWSLLWWSVVDCRGRMACWEGGLVWEEGGPAGCPWLLLESWREGVGVLEKEGRWRCPDSSRG